jgi:hypothetical protein
MEKRRNYETVSEAVNDLIQRGYTSDLSVWLAEDCLICNKTAYQLSPEEFEIDETYRFEGMTDPADEMIVYAISSIHHNIKGTVVNGYGMYADGDTSRVVARLKNHS